MTIHLNLTLHFLRYQWRDRLLLTFALVILIGVGTLATVGFFSSSIKQGMNEEASDLFGADWLVESYVPLPIKEWTLRANALNLKTSQTIELLSVVGANGHLQLASLKAIDVHNPLSGALKIQTVQDGPEQVVHHIPPPGEIWIAPRLLTALHLQMGDELEIDTKKFKITGLLTYEPDAGLAILSVAPRVLMNIDDMVSSKLLSFGAQVKYRFLVSGSQHAIKIFAKEIKPQLTAPQKILDNMTSHPELVQPIENLLKFLTLTAFCIFILTTLAMILATRAYAEKQSDNTAILRCLGATKSDIRAAYLSSLLLLTLILSAAACLLGYGICRLFIQLTLLLWDVVLPLPELQLPLILSIFTGMTLVLGFAWPWLLNLQHVCPTRVLQRQLPAPSASIYMIYASMIVALCMLWIFYQSSFVIVSAWVVTMLIVGCFSLLSYVLLRYANLLGRKVIMPWRLGLMETLHAKRNTLVQMIAYAFTLTILFFFLLMRQDFLNAWGNKFPPDSPNYFVINILPQQMTEMKHFFSMHEHAHPTFNPVVRARLTAVNNRSIVLNELPSDAPEELRQDFNVSYADILNSKTVIQGRAWDEEESDQALISIDGGMAKSLQAEVGDILEFSAGDTNFLVKVESIRAVDWFSIQPNFYAITTPSVLKTLPMTYLGSFYLDKKDENFINDLATQFPNLTFINVNDLINSLKNMLAQSFIAVEILFFLVGLATLLMVWVMIRTQVDALAFTTAVLRTLGATQSQILRGWLTEFAIIGFIIGIFAMIIAQFLSLGVTKYIFLMPPDVYWPALFIAPCVGAILYTAIGFLMLRQLAHAGPVIRLIRA